MYGKAQVRSRGTWLSQLAPAGGLKWSTGANGGCLAASWSMDLPKRFLHPALRIGSLVDIRVGSSNLWSGFINAADTTDDGWEFNALGLYAKAADAICLDGSGNVTYIPDTAVDQAINRGFPFTRPYSISPTALSPADSSQNDDLPRLNELLDLYCQSTANRWGVNENRELVVGMAPTTPMWRVVVDDVVFGLADDEYASDLYGRYQTGGNPPYATATAGNDEARSWWGRREYAVDLSERGVMSFFTAGVHLGGLLAQGKARQGWTNSVEVAASQICTIGGTAADLRLVQGGQMVRMFGAVDPQGAPLPYLDWVIGEAEYEAGAGSITLSPLGLAERNLTDVVAGEAA